MRRYWLSKDQVSGDQVSIRGDELHHIRDVCRQHKGAKFEVIVDGQALLVEIVSESKHESLARVLERRPVPELPKPHIHLVISIPRFPVFEAVVEKSVELGVSAVHPVVSDFSFIRQQSDVFEKKRARFEKIVVGATQQSGRGSLMPIEPVTDLETVLRTFNRGGVSAGLFAYEGQGVLSAQRAIAQMRERNPQDLWLFVGSEGGFSEREVEVFSSMGLKPVTLGAQVLRVETACVALVSVLKYGFDLMR
jgi:16S rRNA (uracil1498-N3)-methyltransferase